MKLKNYTAVQCCNCLKVIGLDFEGREIIKDLYCMSCALKIKAENDKWAS